MASYEIKEYPLLFASMKFHLKLTENAPINEYFESKWNNTVDTDDVSLTQLWKMLLTRFEELLLPFERALGSFFEREKKIHIRYWNATNW